MAGSIMHAMRARGTTGNTVYVRAIGVSAIHTALKGCALARSTLAGEGYDLLVRPGFVHLRVDGKDMVAASLGIVVV